MTGRLAGAGQSDADICSSLVDLRELERDATLHLLRWAQLDDDVLQKMQKQSKRQRQSKRRKRLKMRAPPKPDLRMEIYNESNGVVTHLTWRTGESYRAAAAFLKNLPGQSGLIPGDPGKPEFYIVETREQMDAFWAFAEALSKTK